MGTSSANQHDVFIDFSWEDTRYSFVSHLSDAFHRNKISTFVREDFMTTASKTDLLELPDVIESMIDKATIFVVVFSKNYAFSPLCLETLLKFLERRRDGLVEVIPVFYGKVTPLMVEQQLESFGEAFSKHKSLFSDERVQRWRNSLIEAANLQGRESNNQPNDSELVEEIVADVCEKLNPTGKIGVYLRVLGIRNLLCKRSHDIYRLGIWGMSGIGKTTIAQTVSDQMSNEFETVCFIQDFQVKFLEKGPRILREEYFVEELRENKVLLVLDDVCNPLEAESFLGGFDCFGPGSLVIITSRDKQVLYQCQVEGIYEVPTLNKAEALRLFTKFAFPDKEPSDSNLVEVSKKVVEYSNGNPKALCFYGKTLEAREKKNEIESDFEKIKKCPPPEIIDMFNSSYDVLSNNERSIFLDIACFFNGEKLDRIIPIFEGCGFFPHVGIDRLIERSLLKISGDNKVEMQNLIRDFGLDIINKEKKQIVWSSRLWDPSCVKLLLEENEPQGTEVIEGIFLDTTDTTVIINPMAFENMYNLKLLKIYSSNSKTAQQVHLPTGLHYLPYELRLLHWEKYPLQSLPQDFDPSHLVELNMPYSQLKIIWEGTKSLASLKIVNLSHSQHLVKVDELAKACCLEQIDLQGCTTLESIPDTDCLTNLQHLNLSGCTGITRTEITEKIKGLDLEDGLSETEPDSMVFSILVQPEPEDISDPESP